MISGGWLLPINFDDIAPVIAAQKVIASDLVEQETGLARDDVFRFVDFYFRRPPEEAWPSIDDAYIEGRGWEGDLAPVRFLRMEDLNRELHDYLVGAGFPRDRVEFVLKEGRILPGGSSRPRDRDWTSYYTPALRGKVRRRERLLFSAFPWYDAP